MSPKMNVSHPTFVAILSSDERVRIRSLSVKEDRFQLDKNMGVFYHLENMYNAYSDQTGDVIISDEALIEGSNLQIMESLLEAELSKLKSIHLNKWTFCSDINYIKHTASGNNESEPIDPIKLYLSENTIKNSRYEIKEGWIENVRFDVNKTWLEVTKKDIEGFINEFLSIVRKAKKENLSLFLTYW